MNQNAKTIVVIGGGIAGISCIEALFHDFEPAKPKYSRIVLISENRLVKRVTNYITTGRQLERFNVTEDNISHLELEAPAGLVFKFIIGSVKYVHSQEKTIVYHEKDQKERQISYDVLCLCHGSQPRQLDYTNRGLNSDVDERIIVIRDTNTVHELRKRLKDCRRLLIVGNGGIGLELVSRIADCEKVWIIRDEFIGCAYFDSGAAKFILDSISTDDLSYPQTSNECISRQSRYGEFNHYHSKETFGPALGPSWCENLELRGNHSHKLEIVYQDEVDDVIKNEPGQEFPLKVCTQKNKQYDCDMIVAAIGVTPNYLKVIGPNEEGSSSSYSCLETSSDGGILVDTQMRTSLDEIYAAGDVVSCDRWPTGGLWFQMRLWTQARQMGHYAGRCIAAHLNREDPSIYFNFECFTHCTSFFGYKLVLLGKFNGQQVEKEFEVIARVEPTKDYVKILVGEDGRIIGAVLVGSSGLEETIENLIHDQIDVSDFKMNLLDNTIDIEDYFD